MDDSAAAKTTRDRVKRSTEHNNVLQALVGLVDPWAGIDTDIERAGTKFVLPAEPVPMSLDKAIELLQRKKEEDEQVMNVVEWTDAFPRDGAVAFQKAIERMFGWASAVDTPSFWGSDPPAFIDVEIGFNTRIRVLWGSFQLPGIDGRLTTNAANSPKGGSRFVLSGKVKKKDHATVAKLAELTREIAAAESIYRNKAIELAVNNDGEIDWWDGITFSDLSGVRSEELVFSETTSIQINHNLWTLIEKTHACRQHSIPLKRGILMEGPYGTGKTLASGVTALKAVDHGWTFLSIDRVAGLKDALHFARKYQPCVIFAEDIDHIVAGAERSTEVNDVLNTIDGIASKGTEIIVVLTTNHVEKINRAMLRPGRLDAIISITPPDAPAVVKLLRTYGRGLIAKDDALERSSARLAGQKPATIRECAERAKLSAIYRNGDGRLVITDEDVLNAAISMDPHIKLLEDKAEEKPEPSFVSLVAEGVAKGLEPISKVIQEIRENV